MLFQHAILTKGASVPSTDPSRIDPAPEGASHFLHEDEKWWHTVLVRVRRLSGTVAIGAVLVLPYHHYEAMPAPHAAAVGSPTSASLATATPLREMSPATTVPQDHGWVPVVVTAGGIGVTGLLTWGGIWIAGRRRRNDLGNEDLNETSAVLRNVALEARRLAGLNGVAGKEDLLELARLVPHVEHAVAQHKDTLHEHLTRVYSLMTELVAIPVEIDVVEDALVTSTTLADVPELMRLASLADRVCRQTRTAYRLVAEVTDAATEAKRMRT